MSCTPDFNINCIFNQFVLAVKLSTAILFTPTKGKSRKIKQETMGVGAATKIGTIIRAKVETSDINSGVGTQEKA